MGGYWSAEADPDNSSAVMGDSEATEVLHQEKAGGVAYEVILATPTSQPPANVSSPVVRAPISSEKIDKRLQAAEQRRKQHETERQSWWSERMARIEEASRKRQEADQLFIQQSRDQLEQKMGASEENRESAIRSMREKIKEHLEQVDQVQKKTKQQYAELSSSIQEKQREAEEARDENTRKMVAKLKEKEELGDRVRSAHIERVEQLKSNLDRCEKKLQLAAEKREKEKQKKLEALHELNTVKLQTAQLQAEQLVKQQAERVVKQLPDRLAGAEQRRNSKLEEVVGKAREDLSKVPVVRSNVEEIVKSQEVKVQELVEAKLAQAEERRQELIEKQREKLKERERHGETVRQNRESRPSDIDAPAEEMSSNASTVAAAVHQDN